VGSGVRERRSYFEGKDKAGDDRYLVTRKGAWIYLADDRKRKTRCERGMNWRHARVVGKARRLFIRIVNNFVRGGKEGK